MHFPRILNQNNMFCNIPIKTKGTDNTLKSRFLHHFEFFGLFRASSAHSPRFADLMCGKAAYWIQTASRLNCGGSAPTPPVSPPTARGAGDGVPPFPAPLPLSVGRFQTCQGQAAQARSLSRTIDRFSSSLKPERLQSICKTDSNAPRLRQNAR